MTDYTKIQTALNDYLTSLQKLQELGVTTNKKDFTSQIGEWFVSELFDGQRAESGVQKCWTTYKFWKNTSANIGIAASGAKGRSLFIFGSVPSTSYFQMGICTELDNQ